MSTMGTSGVTGTSLAVINQSSGCSTSGTMTIYGGTASPSPMPGGFGGGGITTNTVTCNGYGWYWYPWGGGYWGYPWSVPYTPATMPPRIATALEVAKMPSTKANARLIAKARKLVLDYLDGKVFG